MGKLPDNHKPAKYQTPPANTRADGVANTAGVNAVTPAAYKGGGDTLSGGREYAPPQGRPKPAKKGR